MRVLALDTTTPAGSVALVDEDRVVEERRGDSSRTHAERLPGEVMTLLRECGVGLPDVDLFAVASGPGSFTGLRIGIATIQGLAFVIRRRRSSAFPRSRRSRRPAASTPRRRPRSPRGWTRTGAKCFPALYRVSAAEAFTPERLHEVESAAVGDPGATLMRWTGRQRASQRLHR